MTHSHSLPEEIFDGVDLADLDLLDVEIVQTTGTMGIPETGASCCPYVTCSSCCVDPT